MLILGNNGINTFHLSAGIGPKEEHLCMLWTLSTCIQLGGISHQPYFSTRAKRIRSKHRHNPDTAELPLPAAAEDSQGVAAAAIQVGRVWRWGEQNHMVVLFCCGNIRIERSKWAGKDVKQFSPYVLPFNTWIASFPYYFPHTYLWERSIPHRNIPTVQTRTLLSCKKD